MSKKLLAYFFALSIVTFCTAIGFAISPYFKDDNLIMVYLLGVSIVALWGRTGASVMASILSVLVFDFFFVPPYYSLSVSNLQYLLTLLVMLVVTQLIGYLTVEVRRRTEETRQAKMQMEVERFRNTLLLSISHDIRTPLTGIIGSASVLLDTDLVLPENARHDLTQNIFDEAQRLNQLVNNVLQMIRLETASVQLNKKPHALQEIIAVALDKLKKQLNDRKVQIQISPNTPVVALDPMLIEQVLINLLENAIKFSPVNSSLDIFVECEDKNVIVKISDRGSGINPADIDKIFDKFYRGQKPETKGIGLGLAICKNIIEAHHGKIWAENKIDGGAIFCFTLPLTE